MRTRNSKWEEKDTTSSDSTSNAEVEKSVVYSEAQDSKNVKASRDLFMPRQSLLDQETFRDSKNPFKGFFTLFWVGITVYLISTIYRNIKELGRPMSLSLANQIIEDLPILVIADLIMISYTFIAPLLQKLVIMGLVPLRLSLVLKHFFQTILIFGSIYVIMKRDWRWLQSSAFISHSIVMFMKMHSYLSSNYELHEAMLTGKSSPRKGGAQYPNNVTFANYLDYLLVPTLVYEPCYPRTAK